MSKDKDVAMLKNVIERLKADNKYLREQMREKASAQAKIDAQVKSDTKHFREFCEMVLAKDKREMVLGEEYSWDKLSNAEICKKAVDAYIQYNADRTELIKDFLARYEKMAEELDGIKLQFNRVLNGEKLSMEEASKFLEDPTKIIKEEKVKEKIDHTYKKAAESGGITAVVEEDSDLVERERKDEAPLMETSVGFQLTPEAPKVYPAPKQLKTQNKLKKEMIERDMYKLQDIVDGFNDVIWLIIEVLGSVGCSLRKDVVNQCNALAKDRKLDKINDSAIQRNLNNIASIPNLITVEKVKLPLSSVSVIQLDRVGRTIYEWKFERTPIKSEAKLIQEEHDNFTHGYGIVSLAQALYETRRFAKINIMNKKRGIEVIIDDYKTVYVPDLVCIDNNGEKLYFEYELANHNMKNFRVKCDKMVQVTSVLRFVVPNRETVTKLKSKIDNWIRERGVNRLKNTKILVYTYKNLIENKAANLEYDLSVSEAPVVDKT